MRTAARIALIAGALGSLGCTLYTGRNNSSFLLMALFALWVPSPFLALGVVDFVLKQRASTIPSTLYYGMWILALSSVAVYGKSVLMPPKTAAAFVFVAFPFISWLFIVVVGLIAALQSRRNHGN